MRNESGLIKNVSKKCLLMFCALFFANFAAAQTVPSPKLTLAGAQEEAKGEYTITIYWLSVENRAEFPDELFEEAPDLPPCGRNTHSSRSWVQVNESGGGQLYAFCGIRSSSELNKLNFVVRKGDLVPEFVYITITDRKTKKKYSSNLVSTKSK